MPKIGMEPVRRSALINATIAEIGQNGSLDVTVSQIARRAGMSSALAHHYFGSKEQIFLAVIRHILRQFGQSVAERSSTAMSPRDRIIAIIDASFDQEQFDPNVVAAWLAFYVKAQNSNEVARLLRVYARRLNSNLVFQLKEIVSDDAACNIAQGLASMIDGFYIRHALQDMAPNRQTTKALVVDYLDLCLLRHQNN
ncbi:transcriptional regulator BetI [Halocynthiibacter sp. C4]|uniref:transcriptional regulator BetI n=1 Tax=Halocynthiibacter sp. C4 TaxID=2992758 RepID=UPI00237C3B03|nr:transcriptional regulator BetI [Halocynthiibacter sp. C4]MDE0591422.1 transcriptional regulator BetI [Halocynthiibacter sp. C4]